MKFEINKFSRLKKNSGFSLSECIVGLAVFAVLLMILMQVMAFSVTQRKRNSDNLTDMNSQVEVIASGDFRGLSNQNLNPTGGDLVFYEADASGDPIMSAEVAKIEGNVIGHFDANGTLRVTAPEFQTTSFNEFDTIVADWGATPNTYKFYSSLETSSVQISETSVGNERTWSVNLVYTPVNMNYVVYVVMPPGVHRNDVSVGNLNECSARVISGVANNFTVVRIINLDSGNSSLDITFNSTTTLATHFSGAGSSVSLTPAAPDNNNYN
ncbi:MAG: prepilin-type N-terminal cleavage/methylation domain-containing protein [Oscillospiraceae bacterium]|nr:prepilin-type N-terminal cleavage/methylation domain-containing protein [Oscillospiraceae bacterium]